MSIDELEKQVRMIEHMMEPERQEARVGKKHHSVPGLIYEDADIRPHTNAVG